MRRRVGRRREARDHGDRLVLDSGPDVQGEHVAIEGIQLGQGPRHIVIADGPPRAASGGRARRHGGSRDGRGPDRGATSAPRGRDRVCRTAATPTPRPRPRHLPPSARRAVAPGSRTTLASCSMYSRFECGRGRRTRSSHLRAVPASAARHRPSPPPVVACQPVRPPVVIAESRQTGSGGDPRLCSTCVGFRTQPKRTRRYAPLVDGRRDRRPAAGRGHAGLMRRSARRRANGAGALRLPLASNSSISTPRRSCSGT